MNEHEQLEQEVLDAVMSGRWETPWAEPLRAHAAGCPPCSDLALVAGHLRLEREAALAKAHPPSASLVWWKAQLRARREAAERVARPVAIAEKIGLGFALVAVLIVAAWVWAPLSAWFASGWHGYKGVLTALFSPTFTLSYSLAIVLTAGIFCVTVCALYAVFARE